MKDGYIRAAVVSPRITVADCAENARVIGRWMEQAEGKQAGLVVFPELCLTGYTCGDLFLHQTLLDAAESALETLLKESRGFDAVMVVGLPVRRTKLYNCAAVLHRGRLLGVVPKTYLPNYAEFYEQRHFTSGVRAGGTVTLAGQEAPFGTDLLFACENLPDFVFGVEICEDVWVPVPPSCRLALAGATVIANLSASTQVAGKAAYLRGIVGTQSGRCISGYLYAGSGEGESSTDLVFSGHLIVAENGRILEEREGGEGMLAADLDMQLLAEERRRTTSFGAEGEAGGCRRVPFRLTPVRYAPLLRLVGRHPFVPPEGERYRERCKEVLDIQTAGLAKRLAHTRAKTAVVAVSGGLDSTLALLVAHRAIENAGLSCAITAITMPGPGTSGRTRGNADALCRSIGATLKVIPISGAVEGHLADIGHDGSPDTAFENAQARERMQIAMDVSNMEGGIVVGTGDMSELALGFTTYNGDHMSMYGVNAGVPKTLVRHLIRYVADENAENTLLRDTLYDILDTPVSPELLPAKDGDIPQKTEQILGPYELHDFFLYYFLRFGFSPEKILRLAFLAFADAYEETEIRQRLADFLRRFFAAQFKRSCLPDGPKVGSVALSPRGDWRMPSDAVARAWLNRLENAGADAPGPAV
ncbi:NAD(+) synthase [Ethanoligenens harbinense]|uniref:Glutamine-dependent NAD(+) synthetase n=1 Tax=Ethanoligenens harbinense (strain DSM 18485 / JCM 12961 / CGMCC 1.5033 / YUAN-3) TaxID=663278 RepID=E6U2T2_ETHHY|nr:NAD(+) synthase [Ethanoligenens harbinense]ADU27474.1 NAD+ synthetase [Ethanoligenens harbinense YUAN-3]AVQ96530.1 NAD(+) synthase [Ethanoligenens harbinense YUAN-3]AYF39192.1 NAD(+) synthase [Ethanoligenens harbinense]AYF42015.1 NAD(+) synthase [Ethanoligenens harbinense]QCN92770.1 NAD(+) synthase [Ethanoligenens harbinense]